MLKTSAPLVAYVNHGRWVADCIFCRQGLALSRGEQEVPLEFIFTDGPCPNCGMLVHPVFPAAADLIDAALSVRPFKVVRNWYQVETVQDLLDENGRNL